MNLSNLPPVGTPEYWRAIRQLTSRAKVDIDRLWGRVANQPWTGAPNPLNLPPPIPPLVCNQLDAFRLILPSSLVISMSHVGGTSNSVTLSAGEHVLPITATNTSVSSFNRCFNPPVSVISDAAWSNISSTTGALPTPTNPSRGGFTLFLEFLCGVPFAYIDFRLNLDGPVPPNNNNASFSLHVTYYLCGSIVLNEESESSFRENRLSGFSAADSGSTFSAPESIIIIPEKS